jgi:hypothetical protein
MYLKSITNDNTYVENVRTFLLHFRKHATDMPVHNNMCIHLQLNTNLLIQM